MMEGKSKEEEKYIFIPVFIKFCWNPAALVHVRVCALLSHAEGGFEWSQEACTEQAGARL